MTGPDAAFFAIHSDLAREGPGDRASLDRALARAGVRPDGTICDAGCGPGADIEGLLAHVPRGRVHAVDLHPPFIDAVRARFATDPRVTAEVADMTRLAGPFDLIWSAGAIYGPGIGPALTAFRAALAPGGHVAFSELCWLGPARPGPAAAFWAAEHPAMTDIAGLEAQIAAAGARTVHAVTLPPAASAAYYEPMEARLDALAPSATGALAEAIALHRHEIDIWRRFGDSFGHRLFVVAP
ncbi:MAG: class I SAM-dependent methyltransferase [Alkalilacustris sp.]